VTIEYVPLVVDFHAICRRVGKKGVDLVLNKILIHSLLLLLVGDVAEACDRSAEVKTSPQQLGVRESQVEVPQSVVPP